MWIVRWLLVAIVMILMLGFFIQNQTQTVTVHYLKWQSPSLPLYLVIFISFCFGLVVWFLVAVFREVQMRSELRRYRRENRRLQEELMALRSLPLEEEVEGEEAKEEQKEPQQQSPGEEPPSGGIPSSS